MSDSLLTLGRVRIDMIVNMNKDLGGEFILNSISLEVPSENKLWASVSIYPIVCQYCKG